MTTFRGEPATKKQIVEQVARLAKAFTNPTKDFYRILMERIAAHGMTQRQLTEAVDRTIDTCKYPTFSVADIVGYDVRYRVYTYAEMLTEMSRTGMMQRDFAILFIEGREKAVWVTFADKVKYNIPDTIKL